MAIDPIVLAAQARAVLQGLHKQNDVVVRFKTDQSGYREDALDDIDREAPGHFQPGKNVLNLNLDELVKGKSWPRKLDSVEDFREFPVLAGVAAHESGHARWSLWDELPESIPNPDFDPFAQLDEDGNNPTGPESYPVSETGAMAVLAHKFLEEPRIERLGVSTFTKTWRKAMQYSAGHLILENIDEMQAEGDTPLDSAVGLAILVGGRVSAGTLGVTYESRKAVKKVLASAQAIIEKALEDREDAPEDPYHKIMGLVNQEVFNNDHGGATSHLEIARQILKIIHPENADDPDQGPGPGQGAGDDDEEGEGEGEGSGSGAPGDPALAGALEAMANEMKEAMDGLTDKLSEMVESDEEMPEGEKGGGGHGSTLYKNPNAPQISHTEQPNAADRELYHLAKNWMERQIEPTVTETEVGFWLPVGGARLNMRSHIRDNLSNRKGSQRSDWDRVSETVKAAPPVKVGIMLDGSGSMRSMARPSASIAWAAANAAAQLPESRTVSVVYGAAAQVTQQPGHVPARHIAVSNTDGPTEDFIGAAKMVEDALWLDEPLEEDERTNVLIIIVSDLQYGGVDRTTREKQMDGFHRIVKDWDSRGYQVVVVGAEPMAVRHRYGSYGSPSNTDEGFTIKRPEELFR